MRTWSVVIAAFVFHLCTQEIQGEMAVFLRSWSPRCVEKPNRCIFKRTIWSLLLFKTAKLHKFSASRLGFFFERNKLFNTSFSQSFEFCLFQFLSQLAKWVFPARFTFTRQCLLQTDAVTKLQDRFYEKINGTARH